MGKPDKQKKPQTPLDQLPIERRLAIVKYDANDCQDAIQGRRIPITFGEEVHRLCVIRGIRYNYGFAQELRGALPEFTRALNARDIMSGIIPAMSSPDEKPYCIWHPDAPSEDTLWALTQKYPDMVYHAARACAVGGYMDLYKELDILPEVHVAEEAGYASKQKGSPGSEAIYQHIISQPVKFAIMNDYKRTVDVSGRRITPLNGDTAVYSSLEAKSKYYGPKDRPVRKGRWAYKTYYFNIAEDWGIDDHDCEAPDTPDDDFPLVYSPLPIDLPLIDKDGLISVAAYMGDIDRYTRLRRPVQIEHEWNLVMHGIYHNAFFAKWCSTQISEDSKFFKSLQPAINARRIMSNDLSFVTESSDIPDMIYYPSFASGPTYEELAHIRPDKYRTCLQACIGADRIDAWNNLLLEPPENISYFQSPRELDEPEDLKLWRISRIIGADIWQEAEGARNPQFLQEIEAAVSRRPEPGPYWHDYSNAFSMYHPCSSGIVRVDKPIQPSSGVGPYDGEGAGIGNVDYAVFVMDVVGKEGLEEEKKRQKSSLLTAHDIYEFLKAKKASKQMKL